MPRGWSQANIPDQSGRTVIITGASSGLGLETARALAAKGAHVVLAVRDVDRGRNVARSITGKTEVRPLDLADLASVRAFANAWTGTIDVLVNNAGVMIPPLQRTADGFELQFGTNHLGHFAMTNLLLPQIVDRVVTVTSLAHHSARIDLQDPNYERRLYSRMGAYGQSKLANLLFTLGLQIQLDATGSHVRALAAHPGLSRTNLFAHTRIPGLALVIRAGNMVLGQSANRGALSILFASTEDISSGSFVGPNGIGELRGAPKLVGRSATAADVDLADRLWALSEGLTGVVFPVEIDEQLPREGPSRSGLCIE